VSVLARVLASAPAAPIAGELSGPDPADEVTVAGAASRSLPTSAAPERLERLLRTRIDRLSLRGWL